MNPAEEFIDLYLHIPKTAGTTMNHVLGRVYPKNKTFAIDNLRPMYSVHKDLAKRPETYRSALRLVKGHMYFGVHRYFNQEHRYFTILRDPIARVVSLFKEISRSPETEVYKAMVKNNWNLRQLVESGVYAEMSNDLTRRVLGTDFEYGATDQGLVQKAIEHLDESFSCVGMQEHFDESILLFAKELSWKKKPYYLSLNKSVKEKKVEVKTDELTLEAIRKVNQLDIQLYAICYQRFRKTLDENEQFLVEALPHFQKKNAQFQKLAKAYLHWFR